MDYSATARPFSYRCLSDDLFVAVSQSGDHVFLKEGELNQLLQSPESIPLERQIELRSRFFLQSQYSTPGLNRLLASRQKEKRATVNTGPSLHIIVPTLQCAHSCQYCQVSRSLESSGFTMAPHHLDAACDSIFESPSPTLTIEFQGGDPLIRFDLVKHAISRIKAHNRTESRKIRFVIASTLHQLDIEMCEFFKENEVYLSTSLDGPADLHNRNRPIPGRNSYERTLKGIDLARSKIGNDCVSALMTTTRASLEFPEAIVDTYVEQGFKEIFIRPLSSYGFAKRNQHSLGYSLNEFLEFYERALERVLSWNRKGTHIREVYASIIFNKLLSTFDAGYVDLQSPTGAGNSVLVYNYDGYIYPSDEARMLSESGDLSLRLGEIGSALSSIMNSQLQDHLTAASLVEDMPDCNRCAYNQFCAPNPVDAYAQTGDMYTNPSQTEHCQRHIQLFDRMLRRLHGGDPWFLNLAHSWAQPPGI